jgi:23S rRNA A1618 N6-methylase RlmF
MGYSNTLSLPSYSQADYIHYIADLLKAITVSSKRFCLDIVLEIIVFIHWNVEQI